MTTLMKCGHVANATGADGEPVCVIDAGTPRDVAARTIAPEPDLTGRKSECVCGRVQHSDGTTLEGKRLWGGSLPFLSLNADYDEAAGRLDTHYCGHSGWS